MLTRTATLIASAALIAASPPPSGTAPTGLCPTLKKIVSAAAETPSWKSVRKGGTGVAVPAGLAACFVAEYSSESQYACSKDLTAATVKPAYAKLVADVTACLGGQPTRSGDDISTHHSFATSDPSVTVSVSSVEQANANNFGIGLTVVQRF